MRRGLFVSILFLISSAHAANYTAKQVCAALVRGEFFKLDGWKQVPPLNVGCATLSTSILEKTGVDMKAPFYKNMVDYLPGVELAYTAEKNQLAYILTIYSYKDSASAKAAAKLFKISPGIKTFNSANFNVALKVFTNADGDALLRDSYEDMVKSMGKAKADEVFSKISKKFGLDKPSLPSVTELPPQLIQNVRSIVNTLQ